MKIRGAISSELELQESLDFQLPPRVLPILPYDFAAFDDYERVYIPPLDDEFLPHSVTATSDRELIEIFDTLEELTGGLFPNKHSIVEH